MEDGPGPSRETDQEAERDGDVEALCGKGRTWQSSLTNTWRIGDTFPDVS